MSGRDTASVLAEAGRYLEIHEVDARLMTAEGPVADAILLAAETEKSDLLVMGGYSAGIVREVVLGSVVEHVVRRASGPVFVCR